MAAIDLSTYRSEEPELTEEQEEALTQLAENSPTEVMAAFLVWIDYDGAVYASNHPEAVNLKADRAAHPQEMYGACANVMRDIDQQNTAAYSAQLTTQSVIANMMQAAARASSTGVIQQVQNAPNLRNPLA